MKKIVISLLLASGAGMALAAGNQCDKPRNDFDGLYCLNKVYQQADNELNATFQKLSAQLNADGKARLKRGQLAWIRERNEECSETRGEAFLVNLRCATETTVDRLNFLQARYRECVSSGCRNSLLDP